MAYGTATFGETPFGAHAEIQVRNHDVSGDLQQLLLRTSGRYTLPDRSATLSLGYGYVLSESEGQPDTPFSEHRIYQEAALPQRVAVFRLTHRLRYEQRFVEEAAFQTRYRYALFATAPLNRTDLQRGGRVRGDLRGGVPPRDRTRRPAGLRPHPPLRGAGL